MTCEHQSLRAPFWLLERFDAVVGPGARTRHLKQYIDWQGAHPQLRLGPDVDPPYDFLTTARLGENRWKTFLALVGDRDASSMLRRYMWWRVRHPNRELPVHHRELAGV